MRRSISRLAPLLAIGLLLLLVEPTVVSADPTPPFTQCPAIGRDAGCGTLIVVNPEGRLEAFNDPRTGPFGDSDDMLIGVQNDSEAPLRSIFIKSEASVLFNTDNDGICSGKNAPALPGCPFGPTGYEGPGVNIQPVEGPHTSGTIEFLGEDGLPPGMSTYFSLEGLTIFGRSEFACDPEDGPDACHALEVTELATTLSSQGREGLQLPVRLGAAMTGHATLSGPTVAHAMGTVDYDVYSDPQCQQLVADAGTVPVSGGIVPPSMPETLPAGTYYWQTTYSGDAVNAGTQSPCGSATGAAIGSVIPCRQADGAGHLGPRGAESLSEHNHLNVSGSPAVFVLSKAGMHVHLQSLTSATCTGYDDFAGSGPATLNHAGGYTMTFEVTLSDGNTYLSALVEKAGAVVLSIEHEKLVRSANERFFFYEGGSVTGDAAVRAVHKRLADETRADEQRKHETRDDDDAPSGT